ncbi:MAG: energy-coupling factor transporter transmembrane component T [Bryobacteraceae bacterium]
MERWSRGESPLHGRDPRVKILALLSFLVILTTTPAGRWIPMAAYFFLLCGSVNLARLPLRAILLRAAVVLPFSATFACVALLSGPAERAAAIPVKSFLSALAVLLVVATTPLPSILRALEKLGAPRMVLLVVQFLYRYLFVIFEQAQHMRLAAQCRGGFGGGSRSKFAAAAGILAVLFGRSYERAEGIHQAMLARGFDGHLRLLTSLRIVGGDVAFLAAAVVVPLAFRVGAGQ